MRVCSACLCRAVFNVTCCSSCDGRSSLAHPARVTVKAKRRGRRKCVILTAGERADHRTVGGTRDWAIIRSQYGEKSGWRIEDGRMEPSEAESQPYATEVCVSTFKRPIVVCFAVIKRARRQELRLTPARVGPHPHVRQKCTLCHPFSRPVWSTVDTWCGVDSDFLKTLYLSAPSLYSPERSRRV